MPPAGGAWVSPEELLSELEKVARRLGVDVRFEPIAMKTSTRGGLCRVKGKPRIVVDAGAPVVDKVATLERALRKLDTETVFVPPAVRARLEGRARVRVGPSIKKAKGK